MPKINLLSSLRWLRSRKWSSTTGILTIVGVLALWYTMTNFIELSGLAFGLIKIPIGLAVVGLVDNLILGDLNTVDEIKAGNISYAVIYAALVLLVAVSIGVA